MPVDVEVVFDFSSPFSWLACMRIEDVTAKYGDNVNIIWKPCRVMDIWMITQPNVDNLSPKVHTYKFTEFHFR